MKKNELRELLYEWKSFINEEKKEDFFLNKLYEKIKTLGNESKITFSKDNVMIHGENIEGLPLQGKIVFKELYDNNNNRVKIKDKEGITREGFAVDTTVDTTSGYGPLLYDLLIEYVSEKSGFLAPDPNGVSNDAYQVWDIYKNERKDVKRIEFSDFNIKNLDLDYDYDEVLEIFKAFYKEKMEITNLANKNIEY